MVRTFDKPEISFDDLTKSWNLEYTPTPSQLIAKLVAEAIAADREGKIRQALIDLGWTPPRSEENGYLPPHLRGMSIMDD